MPNEPRASPRPHNSLRARILRTPLAIEVNALEGILAILDARAAGAVLTPEAQQALRESQPYGAARNASPPRGSQLAIVGLYGPMMSQAEAMQSLSGATSTREFAAAVRAAANDPNVREIILDIDSPGGSVASIDTAADAVRYAASKKPVTAVTEGMMCSAAYWVGSQATRVVASSNAMVGSISVLQAHADRSGYYEQHGEAWTILTTGDKKALGNDAGPLTEDARLELTRVITDYHQQFVADVAAGRGTSPERVQKDWADGRVETGQTAARIGMVDEVGTLAQVITRITTQAQQGTTQARAGVVQEGASAVKLTDIAKILRDGPRVGAEADEPEGARTLVISDTLANAMADALDTEAAALATAQSDATAATEAAEALVTATRRTTLAERLVTTANLPPVSVEADAAFVRQATSAAIAADTDELAAGAVTALIEERQALLATARGDNHPSLPSSADKATAAAETTAELARIRGPLGLN